MTPVLWALLTGVVSAVGAWFMPRVIASLPERHPEDDVTYRQIAAWPRLPVALAVVAGLVGVTLGWARAGEPDLAAFVVLGVLGTAMGYVDLRRHLLPDRFTVPALASGAVLLGGAALTTSADAAAYWRAWACAGALMLVYLLLALVYPAGLGLGDVKLAASLGLHLGWLGWEYPVVGTVAAFLVGGGVSIVLLLAGRVNRRTALPFGPAMLVGALVAVVWAEPVAAWYLG